MHGERLMLGTDYTEENFFCFICKIADKSPETAKFQARNLADFVKYFSKFINVISVFHAYFRLGK